MYGTLDDKCYREYTKKEDHEWWNIESIILHRVVKERLIEKLVFE